ncbi:MAG: N-acetyl-gamma-glutamyl-phosphate reductase [Spirochaetaceae bacterium]|jgi:N-acetyl-gamma-glutamyl-phosphate reductase|nr:N-acetyl-gamma-glutamyl-phosphate reductase [Spirochaetaceae bacterium]
MTVGILGATGYAAAELTRLLAAHPSVDAIVLSSSSKEGERIEAVYPHFISTVTDNRDNKGNKIEGGLLNAQAVIDRSDVVFAALPAGVSEPFAASCLDRGIPFIDFSADFRFSLEDEAVYAAWYGGAYQNKEAHRLAVYGLPELNRATIKKRVAEGRVVIGNPGCYPTACTLGLYPALAKGLAAEGTIIADCASGVTGGGRETKREYHYSEAADAVTPYKVGAHRHTPEIARNIRQIENTVHHSLIFTPHLAPMNRGILATIYVPLDEAWHEKAPQGTSPSGDVPLPPSEKTAQRAGEIHALYEDFYRNEPFVRVLPPGITPSTARVRGSNFCDISVHLVQNQTGSTLIICAAIDNMVKGAAGQAVQNMNIVLGRPETEGLTAIPLVF